MLANQKIDWRNRSNVGFIKRFMGLYESPEEILAGPYNCDAAFVGYSNRIIARLGCGAIYLYTILIAVIRDYKGGLRQVS